MSVDKLEILDLQCFFSEPESEASVQACVALC